MSDKRHPAAVKHALTRRLRKLNLEVPTEYQAMPPVVTWRARGCRCWLLHVYLTPDGWVLDGRDFPEPITSWIKRLNPDGTRTLDDGTPITLESYRAGRWSAFSTGEVSGVRVVLPHDVDEWEVAQFEVGCQHGAELRPLSDVAEDCRTFRATRRAVTRSVAYGEQPLS